MDKHKHKYEVSLSNDVNTIDIDCDGISIDSAGNINLSEFKGGVKVYVGNFNFNNFVKIEIVKNKN